MKILLSGINIVKSFVNGEATQRVLNGITLDIKHGEFVAIMGASGSGKSTLLYALSGMDNVDSGEVIFNDTDLSTASEIELADIRRKEMGFVFQQPTLLKNLNIIDNIIFPQLRDHKNKIQSLKEKALNKMEELGIGELSERSINQVSGGQLQRADICRSLMNEPKIIFADEPTGALNSSTSEEIMDIFSQINENGTAIVLVTHDIKVASRADRVLFMKDGAIVGDIELDKYDKQDFKIRLNEVIKHTQKLGI